MVDSKETKKVETPKKKTSPLFNSTSAVELKSKRAAGVDPSEEMWEFLSEVIKVKKD